MFGTVFLVATKKNRTSFKKLAELLTKEMVFKEDIEAILGKRSGPAAISPVNVAGTAASA
jgi:hypothetical protein